MANTAKRALSHVGGRVHIEVGADGDRELLEFALHVSAEDPYLRSHVHGFHAYPARLHPVTAQRLVKGLSRPGDRVLDPFCGSGTVLVEALLEGRSPSGLDANPLAVMLTTYKLQRANQEDLGSLLAAARAVAESADARRMRRAGPSRRYPVSQARQFDPHVLLELDGLRAGIEEVKAAQTRKGLLLVLSSIANKVSRQESDTSNRQSQRRWASGFVIQFFVKKAEELAKRQAQFGARLAERGRETSTVKLGDARHLPFENAAFAAVITSPPYPGVYDYVEHHRLRLQWLGLDVNYLAKHEIGARRQAHDESATYNEQMRGCLGEMSRIIKRTGTIALVVADTVVNDVPWYADREIESIASRVGLKVVAAAAQPRPHFHRATAKAFGRRPRSERVLLLRPAETARGRGAK